MHPAGPRADGIALRHRLEPLDGGGGGGALPTPTGVYSKRSFEYMHPRGVSLPNTLEPAREAAHTALIFDHGGPAHER